MNNVVTTPLEYFFNIKEEIINLVKDYIDKNCVDFKKDIGEGLLSDIQTCLEDLVKLAPQEINECTVVGQGPFSASQSDTIGGKGSFSGLNYSNSE